MATLLELAPTPSPVPDLGAGPTRTLRVARTRRDAGEPPRETFTVPADSPWTSVLDALTWARTHLDPTLDVRHACFHASCGTCGVRVNGREALACVTRLDDLADGEILVEPLRNLPLVSDLVVELEALGAALDDVGLPPVRASEAVPGSVPPDGVDAWTRFEDCIECGLCVSACPIAASDAAYAGPAVLEAAWRILAEPRDADADAARALVDGDQGAWRCHLAFECSEACPSGACPGEGVMRLRRALLAHRLLDAVHHARPHGRVP